jgi:hypothetical protein
MAIMQEDGQAVSKSGIIRHGSLEQLFLCFPWQLRPQFESRGPQQSFKLRAFIAHVYIPPIRRHRDS